MTTSNPEGDAAHPRRIPWGRLVLTVTVCLLLGIGCSSATDSGKPVRRGAKVNVTHFSQQPAAYRGKIISLALIVEEAIQREKGQSLQQYTNRYVKFRADGPKQEKLHLVIRIPDDIAIPDVAQGDEVIVTFLCSRGNPQQGNEAKAIEKR